MFVCVGWDWEGWGVAEETTDQGQERYEAITFTDAAHYTPSSTGNPSRRNE